MADLCRVQEGGDGYGCETRHRAWETFGTGSDGQTFAVGKLYGLAMCWLFVGVRQLDSRGSMPTLSSSMHPRSSLTPLIFFLIRYRFSSFLKPIQHTTVACHSLPTLPGPLPAGTWVNFPLDLPELAGVPLFIR